MTMKVKFAPLQLTYPRISTEWFDEPKLLFANNMTHCDPKIGIALYGPRSLGTTRHKQEVHIGFIGTGEAMERARKFYGECAGGVAGDADHISFPGCRSDRGFRCDLRTDENLYEMIARQEILEALSIKNSRERFEFTLSLLQKKMDLLTRKDYPLDYIVLVPPTDLYQKCRVTDYTLRGVGKVHRDLRRAFKAIAMQFRKPTQILQETTIGLVSTNRQLDHPSEIAWNLFTGLYFKVEGLPWGPVGLPPATCFIGISFFRPLGERSTLRTSVVQAFDENGEGLVLRGQNFHWDEQKQGKSPHLSEELANELIEMVLQQYLDERKQLPQRVVVHKSSRFEPEERSGFEKALALKVKQYDLVSLHPSNDIRLIRAGRYPPVRGASFTLGEVSYLYTTGYIPSINGYPHGHVPSPQQIADHIGDSSKSQIMREIMILTKMNFNSAELSGSSAITQQFSRLVGDILREVPSHEIPQFKYKYYT